MRHKTTFFRYRKADNKPVRTRAKTIRAKPKKVDPMAGFIDNFRWKSEQVLLHLERSMEEIRSLRSSLASLHTILTAEKPTNPRKRK